MPTSRSSVSVEASPEEVFAFVGDVANLPRYLPGVASAVPTGGEAVRVTWDVDGSRRVTDAWFRVKAGRHRRIEWGSDGPSHYHGWLEIDPEGEVASVTVELHTDRPSSEDLDAAVDGTLFALKQQIEEGRVVS